MLPVRALNRIKAIGALRGIATTAQRQYRLDDIETANQRADLSKFDPVYDDVSENHSVIELWKKQKLRELGGNAVSASEVDEIVRKEHNILYKQPFDDTDYPKMLPHKAEIFGTEGELYWSEDLLIPYDQFKRLVKKTLIVKRTVQMTRKGKIPSMYALVVVGNGRGAAGYGEGKNIEVSKAALKATRQAIRNMQYFPRYDERTIYHDIEHKFKATKLHLWARRPGFGCRVAPMIHEICECIGIQDLAGKIHGSRNPMNVIKATFEAFQTQRLPEDLAKARGLRLVDVQHTYYGVNRSQRK